MSRATTASPEPSLILQRTLDGSPWSAEEMLRGQRQRVDVPAPAHVRTADKGLLEKSLEEGLC